MNLHGTTVLVTGAGAGMGRAICVELIKKGAKVAAVDIKKDGLVETGKVALAIKKNYLPIVLDITNSAKVATLPKLIAKQLGSVDVIINNAGIIQPFVRLEDLKGESISKVMDVNLFAPLNLIRAFLPTLKVKKRAFIVNTSSMGAYTPVPGQSLYGASKAALAQLSAGLASELGNSNVKVMVVFPGAVATEIAKNSGIKMPKMDIEVSKIKMSSAQKAAKMIVDGIEKDKKRIYIGHDAKIMNLLNRGNPNWAAYLINKQMKDLLK
jgi:short-subunit dehydrogenase